MQDVKISEDNILSDIMSDLDGNASAAVKPKPVVTKTNIVESSKRDAQNYFKSLSSAAKKPTTTLLSKEQPAVKVENVNEHFKIFLMFKQYLYKTSIIQLNSNFYFTEGKPGLT